MASRCDAITVSDCWLWRKTCCCYVRGRSAWLFGCRVRGAPACIAARRRGAGFSPSCSLQCSRLLLEAVGHLQLKDWRQLCSDAVGAGRIPLEIQEGWGWGGEAVCQPQRSDAGYSSVHCIIFCFSRSSSFLKRDVWQAASPGSRLLYVH